MIDSAVHFLECLVHRKRIDNCIVRHDSLGDSLQKRPTVISSKPANGSSRPGLRLFYPVASCGGKSVLVRQLRGPHLSTCPWCSKRSSMALTAAASPSSLPQSSTGRFEVSMVLARS